MTRKKIDVDCLYCGRSFKSTLRWEGIPEKDFCSIDCEREDQEMGTTYEKMPRSQRSNEWR